jgi:hypothetical protein
MSFQIRGLSPQPFEALFAQDAASLAAQGIQRVYAHDDSSYPCRVSLMTANQGDELLLLPYEHQPAHSPYRASGPIFVRRDVAQAALPPGQIPAPVVARLLSVRAYDARDCIVEAEVVEGRDLAPLIDALFARDDVRYLHLHYARRGCYACRVERLCS